MRLVQFGAGNIGRGFVAPLFAAAGWEVVFVEVAPEIVAALRERGGYTVELVGPRRHETLLVRGVRGVDGRDREAVAAAVATADLVATAVGAAALPHIAPALAAGLVRRPPDAPPLHILLCENERHVARRMAALLAAAGPPAAGVPGAGFQVLSKGVPTRRPAPARRAPTRSAEHGAWSVVETIVSRMVPVLPAEERARDPLRVVAEEYDRLPVDARALIGTLPAVPGLEPRHDFDALVERKLFVHNMAHAVAAYLGYGAGHTFIHEAMADPGIAPVVSAAMEEACAALIRRHGLDPAEQEVYRADLLLRFANPALRDTVTRVGRDPARKLRPEDRLVGAALLALEEGITPRAIARGIAAALRFDPPGDPSAAAIQAELREGGRDVVLAGRCGIPPRHPLATLVRAADPSP